MADPSTIAQSSMMELFHEMGGIVTPISDCTELT